MKPCPDCRVVPAPCPTCTWPVCRCKATMGGVVLRKHWPPEGRLSAGAERPCASEEGWRSMTWATKAHG